MQALTSEFIYAVLWLTCPSLEVSGSGILIQHEGHEYLATAHHVATACHYSPLIRHNNKWVDVKWEVVSDDINRDITVLRTAIKLIPFPAKYGMGKTLYSGIGRAVGFPNVSAEIVMEEQAAIFGEMGGRPIPATVLVSTMLGDLQSSPDAAYAGGFINSGFSGGAMVYPTNEQGKEGWSIVGIITERGSIWRQYGQDSEGRQLIRNELSGMIRFVPIQRVLEMIAEVN